MVFKVPGDPRRPNEVRKYERPEPSEEPTPDAMTFAALALGITAVTLKIKICSWLSFFCCISSLCTIKTADMEAKQVVTSITFAVFGLIASYAAPQRTKG
uniref:Protein Asterix n=1 Tax=Tetraselmis sp. GSL018 TaxID=582737 RepID=A0A061R4W0_9CHLO|mmetsp:Transcript_13391/g.31709  ORF Transcript_13391/g.31709 Transcript_13391/m.31709 type:complete len:100 (+) Transcript_13391:148-447(+)